MSEAKFSIGKLVATPGALEAFARTGQRPIPFVARHQLGDWGDVPPEDAEENELSVREGLRILSSYRLQNKTRMWIITEADRSSTCVLLPEEY